VQKNNRQTVVKTIPVRQVLEGNEKWGVAVRIVDIKWGSNAAC